MKGTDVKTEMLNKEISSTIRLRHRGRFEQIFIYFRKFMRLFVYQNEWKVFPMAAIVAAAVSIVVRRDFFQTMEGTLKGAFALTCISIWNGCFNSIQSVCREREIIKREHRSGMHISSYMIAHMLYQALLCMGQTILTLYVFRISGVNMPEEGLITGFFFLDIAVTMFLATYAADMMSLLISTIARTPATAMTVMPFILIFQLVFSGGIFSLPAWTEPIGMFTISGYSTKCFMAQADYNNKPLVTIWNTLHKIEDNELSVSFTLNDVMKYAQDESNPTVSDLRKEVILTPETVGNIYGTVKNTKSFKSFTESKIDLSMTLGELLVALRTSEGLEDFRESSIAFFRVEDIISLLETCAEQFNISDVRLGKDITVQELMDLLHVDDIIKEYSGTVVGEKVTVGDVIDFIASDEDFQAVKNEKINISVRVGDIIDFIGRERIINYLESAASAASYNPQYEHTVRNVWKYWISIWILCAAFGVLSIISLEFVDKDRR